MIPNSQEIGDLFIQAGKLLIEQFLYFAAWRTAPVADFQDF